eukprot:3421860-Rhodomonas_salina.1
MSGTEVLAAYARATRHLKGNVQAIHATLVQVWNRTRLDAMLVLRAAELLRDGCGATVRGTERAVCCYQDNARLGVLDNDLSANTDNLSK